LGDGYPRCGVKHGKGRWEILTFQTEVYGRENHPTKYGIFQQNMFDYGSIKIDEWDFP
jgi:hypothetical protein